MTVAIEWSPKARWALDEIAAFVSQDNPDAADRLVDQLEAAVTPLADFPNLFRPGRKAGTRELIAHPNYIVVYSGTQGPGAHTLCPPRPAALSLDDVQLRPTASFCLQLDGN